MWLRRKRRWFTFPLSRENGVTVLQPWHTWRRVGRLVAVAVTRGLRPDILHLQEQIHSFHESPAAADVIAAAPRSVATVHEVHPELRSCEWTAAAVRRAGVVVTNDRFTAEKCGRHIGRIPDAVLWSPSNVKPPAEPPARCPGLVVTFGFLSAIKGIELLHTALRLARERVPGLRWRLVGPFYPERDPHHAALAVRVRADWIEFTGGRNDLESHELRRWLAEAAVMALPFADGASARRTTLHTAWAFGIPVVTTPPPGPDDAVRPGENCLTVPPDDAAGWAGAVERVLTDRATADHLAAGSRAAGTRFGWPCLVAEHLRLYDSLLNRAAGGSP